MIGCDLDYKFNTHQDFHLVNMVIEFIYLKFIISLN